MNFHSDNDNLMTPELAQWFEFRRKYNVTCDSDLRDLNAIRPDLFFKGTALLRKAAESIGL